MELFSTAAGVSAVHALRDLPSTAAADAGINGGGLAWKEADARRTQHHDLPKTLDYVIVDWRALSPLTLNKVDQPPRYKKEEQPSKRSIRSRHARDQQISNGPVRVLGERSLQALPIVAVFGLVLTKLTELRRTSGGTSTARIVELVASLALFLVSGPSIILLNKHIMKEYHFHFPILLSSLGNLLLVVVTRVSTALGFCRLANPTMDWRRYVRVVLLLNLFNFGTQVVGMWTYLFVSVPEIQILKSATVVLTMIFAVAFVKEEFNSMLVVSIAIITAGAVITAICDGGQARLEGYGTGAQIIGILLCLMASTFEAAKSVCSQILMDSLPIFDGLYWCSPAFVLLAVIFISALELKNLIHFQYSASLCGCLVANAVLTGIVVPSSFWFVKLVGALSLKVVTQARTVGLILVSVFFFGEHCTDLQYVGCTATVIGMGVYNHTKMKPKLATAELEDAASNGKESPEPNRLENAVPMKGSADRNKREEEA
eukprot:CAMPEP_0171079776 /NCGR_PEP_ID=MMETSP0766_2-20121228/15462_1 /TAXON_ID=439317 /ORGANISM="Gambierdiscus australes, Strain CAWD 149" /LENGTH=486 /DNA_ID=CAMNT_0011536987 /DNA_START=36 /DNA_END=1496 /DNA_ORIENTATION=+